MNLQSITFSLFLFFAIDASTLRGETSLNWDLSDAEQAKDWSGEELIKMPDGLRLTASSPQSALETKIPVNSQDYKYLKIQMRALSDVERNGFVEWKHTLNKQSHRLPFTSKGAGQISVELQLSNSSEWIGTIEEFKIAPSDQSEKIIVQNIAFDKRGSIENAKLTWIGDFDIERVLSQPTKPVMIYIFSISDPYTKKIREEIFKNQQVIYELQDYHCVRFLDDETSRFIKYVPSVFKFPAFVFLKYDPEKKQLVEIKRLDGYYNADQFLRYLQIVRNAWDKE